MEYAFRWGLEGGEDRQAAARRLLREALRRGAVGAVLCPAEARGGAGVACALATRPEHLGSAVPLARAVPQFGPQSLVRATEPGGGPVAIAAVLKPCEVRAVVELVKLKQVDPTRVVLVSPDCPGTVELEDYARARDEAEGALPLRLACRICRRPVGGEGADVSLGTLGARRDELLLVARTDKGRTFCESVGAQAVESPPARAEAVARALAAGEAAYAAQEEASRERYAKGGAFVPALSTCIKCMNCMNVCPVCYCRECLFYTDAFSPTAGSLADKAKRRGVLRVPTETVQFHLTRMAHVMTACVMCGQCESACPTGIPLVEMYAGINKRIQDLFGYESGRSAAEAPPFTEFREDEDFK